MPQIHIDDTIAAVATPPGEGGIAVIRVSGPGAFSLVESIFKPTKDKKLSGVPSHTLHMGRIQEGEGGIQDQVVVSVFRSPRSFTGEDVLEISCHGGVIGTKKILDLLIGKGARHAEPGEFTRRAFLNGKMDLVQAEAVLDLIRAKSDRSREEAVRQLSGSISHQFKLLKNQLMVLYAHMEAYLDFPDEHLEVYDDNAIAGRLRRIREELEALIATFRRGSLVREGIIVTLIGKPNVGKSSIFNALLSKDRALVSEYPGTTRDKIEEYLEVQGYLVRLVDTAGLGASVRHPLEQMGMEITRKVLSQTHLYLFVVDGSKPLDREDREVFEEISRQFKTVENGKSFPVISIMNKSDLPAVIDFEALKRLTGDSDPVQVSSVTGQGLARVEEKIIEKIFQHEWRQEGEQVTRLRHKNALEAAAASIRKTETAIGEKVPLELVTLEIKEALNSLSELVGEIYSEDLLDVIFSEFCIGK